MHHESSATCVCDDPASGGCAEPLPRLDEADRRRPPNIVVILLDDMGFSDIGCYGGEIDTPNLDFLARGGARFTQFYNMARCCPTRASLLTGLHPHQAGVGHMITDLGLPGYRGDLGPHCVTIAEVLRKAGYRTLMSGKWHVTPIDASTQSSHNWPLQRGFEKHFGTIQGAGSYYDPVTLTRDNRFIEPDGEDFYYTDAISDNAVAYIHHSGGDDQPFFLYVAYTAPHWPMHAFEEDIERYRERFEAGWDVLRAARHERLIEMGLLNPDWALSPRDRQACPWEDAANKDWQIHRMAVYAAMIDRVDQGIGRILAALRKTGRYRNTLILFMSDNGGADEVLPHGFRAHFIPDRTRDGRPVTVGNDPAVYLGAPDTYGTYGPEWANLSNAPFRLFKSWVHEGGIATPLIAHWPNVIEAGGVTHAPGQVMDILPTCLDAARVAYPESYDGRTILPVEGRSLLPVLMGGALEGGRYLYWEHEGNCAVRQGRYKLVSKYPGDWELYDLEADRTELHNVADRHPDKADELAQFHEQWAERCRVQPWEQIRKKIYIPIATGHREDWPDLTDPTDR